MSMPRFYCPSQLAIGTIVRLPDNAAVHACRVLRLEVSDDVILFNGDGKDYLCQLLSIKKSEVTAIVTTMQEIERESALKVTLAQAISSGDRMDFTIQKAVEMGVTAIQPIASQRSVVKLSGDRAEKRREHWQNVVISACEQSGRAIVPQVAAPLSLANWLGATPASATAGVVSAKGPPLHGDLGAMRITLSPTATQTLQDLPKPTGEICLLIGAEGGLTQEEIDLAATHHFTPVRLGKRILRTETAALAALAAIQTLWGDFNI
jgi:16S rRNA (uracil1498-N3)-methyltransferase